LANAFEGRDPNRILLRIWPHFDPIRDDPRYRDLLDRMNFPDSS
jgi:hypothetical protein